MHCDFNEFVKTSGWLFEKRAISDFVETGKKPYRRALELSVNVWRDFVGVPTTRRIDEIVGLLGYLSGVIRMHCCEMRALEPKLVGQPTKESISDEERSKTVC
jgi:hypothetical protein